MSNRFCWMFFLIVCGLLGTSMGQAAMGQGAFVLMVDSSLVDVQFGDAAWGDYDGDGDLDLVITGNQQQADDPAPITQVFQYVEDRIFLVNRSEILVSFFNVGATLPGLWQSTAAWGDYDGDGDLDLLIAGQRADNTLSTQVYENRTAGTFALHANLTGFRSGDVAWGDYDNDGDLDILAAGIEGNGQYRSVVYENQAGNFLRRDVGLVGVAYASVTWGDYDSDGDLDILLAGTDEGQVSTLKIYRNEGQGTFVDASGNLGGLAFPSVDWGDYDNDGDLDIVISGGKYSPFVLEGVVRLYRNEGGLFTLVDALPGNYGGSVTWADVNDDQRPDIFTAGGTRPHAIGQGHIYQNNGSDAFVSRATFTGGLFGNGAWGDYDGDGDLDFVIIGQLSNGSPSASMFRNEIRASGPPPAPTLLQATPLNDQVLLSWSAPPGEGLSYNLRVGTTPGASDIVPPMALPTGRRLLSARGNAEHRLQWSLRLPPGQYFWSVQALNAAFSASPFAPEQSFTTGNSDDTTPPAVPTGFTALSEDGQVVLSWQPNTEPDIARYLLYRGTTPTTETLLTSVIAGTETYTDTDVQNGVTYFYRLQAQDESGNQSTLTEAEIAMPNQRFTEASMTGLPDGINASFAWGDYDGDGDPDLVLGSTSQNAIYRNDNGTFTRVEATLNLGNFPSLDWGDYDGDGDLDLVLAGRPNGFGNATTVIYRNEEGAFFRVTTDLPGVNGNVLWGDYDTDGDLDLLLAGRAQDGQSITAIYRNDNGTFVDSGVAPNTGSLGAAAWGDYDADGDPDLVIAGFSDGPDVFRNDEGNFVGVANVAEQTAFGVAWGDYDADNDLDLLIADLAGTRLYRNDNGNFVDTQIDFPVLNSTGANPIHDVAWADYDNDGDLDLLLAGNGLTTLYRNDDGVFNSDVDDLDRFLSVAAGWADFDSDGDLDLLMAGTLFSNIAARVILYRNNTTF